ncbi:MAG: DUF4825 domain-containing protein [Syntrophomonadaceae bacterium]|nr:DUF4825 domain-containing protein [Syntrophomonadaceae bacterium]
MDKKKGVWLLVLVLALTAACLLMVRNNQQPGTSNGKEDPLGKPDSYAEELYQYHGTYTGDNSKVGAIVNTLNYTNLPFKSIELKTDSEPYGITVNYMVDSRANYRFPESIMTGWNKNAAVMFSLIPNASEIAFRIFDEYGEFTGAYYERGSLNEHYGMEYFTSDKITDAAGSLASFTDYLNKVSAIKNWDDSYSDEQKLNIERSRQIYSVIGDDCEITINSGVNIPVTLTDEIAANPPIKELMAQKDMLAQYSGKKVEFLIYNINNFKTNYGTFYLFAFDGKQMITYADLKTSAAEQNAIAELLKASGEGS